MFISVSGVSKSAVSLGHYNDGLWHHVVGLFNGSNVLLYVDGGKETITGDATTGPIVNTSAVDLVLGNYAAAVNPFIGLIDDARIYNRALTATEIKKLYTLGAVQSPPP